MSLKDKIIFTILSIITLGIYPIIVFNTKNTKTSNQLSQKDKVVIDLPKLIANLGSKKNITGIEFTHTKIKFMISKKALVNVKALELQKGIEGVFAGSKAITIIVGNSAKAISSKLSSLI